MPVRILVTAGTVHDCKQACALIDGFSARWLLGDKGYDSNAIIEKAISQGMNVVIPPKSNRKVQREHDKYLYRLLSRVVACGVGLISCPHRLVSDGNFD